jgi:UDP-glucuronate 4-epimerase
MRILVTGGAGFIGSALVRGLLLEGHTVVFLDNYSLPNQILQRARVRDLCAGAHEYIVDIRDIEALEKVFLQGPFDVLYHIAAKPGVRESITNPHIYASINYQGTLNVFELAKKYGVPHIIFASSSSVYGVNNTAPFHEEADADHPVSVYASTKRAKEILAKTYAHMYGMHITALRFFTVYGPYGRPDMAPYLFTEKIFNDETIQIYNHGKQRRDFTYIDDIVRGCIGVLDHPNGYQVFNLGNDTPVELMDFVATIETHLGKTAKKEFVDAQVGDVTETHADITKARSTFGFEPQTKLHDGMKEFVEWYKKHRSDSAL